MNDDAKKKGSPWGFLLAVVFLLIAYPLSFWAYFWLWFSGYVPVSIETALTHFYEPLIFLRHSPYCPKWLSDQILLYYIQR
jgi:hypothetical protein